MERTNTKTVVGLYDDINDARMAVQELVDRGFDRNNISLMTRSRERQVTATPIEGERREVAAGEGRTSAGEGAGIGAILGGTAGLLVGLGALAIPGIGPVIAAGTLAAAVLGAGAGAIAGGLIGALVGAGIPKEEANYYAEGVRRGGTLVAVTAPPNRLDEAAAILRSHNPVDVQHRAEEWRRSGWTGFEENVSPYGQTGRERNLPHDVGAGTGPGQEPTYSRDFNTYESDFRRHYQNTYGQTGRSYSDYEVGYRYGYNLANEPRYQDREWRDIEPQVRQDWERQGTGNWDDYRMAIQEGWNQGNTVYRGEGVGRREEAMGPEGTDRPYRIHEPGSEIPDIEGTGGTGTTGRGQYTGRSNEPYSRDTTGGGMGGSDWDTGTGQAGGSSRVVEDRERVGATTDYSRYEANWRRHYQNTYGQLGGTYEDYEPGYRYGYNLANEPRYQDREWRDIEPQVRQDWETRNEGPWERFKDAIREGWDEVRGRG